MRISASRARRLRAAIMAHRCNRRPGITHHYRWTGEMVEEGFDYTRGAPLVPLMRCTKCRHLDP